MNSNTAFLLYLIVVILLTAAAFYFYKSRLRMIGAGVILIGLGCYWLYLKEVPGRLLPDITGAFAQYAGWITVLCGIVLILFSDRKQ